MKHWVFDLGNTRLKCAPLGEAGGLGDIHAFGHDKAHFLEALLQVLPARAESACLASVAAPELTAMLVEALTTRFQRISLARSCAQLCGVRIAYAEPARLGVDRFLSLLAARARDPRPCLIAGVGTAVTVDLLDGGGLHRGGRIAPSPWLMRHALHQAARQLPALGGDYREFADDTADALASGCDGAALGLIERSLDQAEKTLGQPVTLLLHGGGGEALAPYLPRAVQAPSLVLQGLALWSRLGVAAA